MARTEEVNKYLKKFQKVNAGKKSGNITFMAGSMYQIAKKCFPNAIQTIDRFHVQKLMSFGIAGSSGMTVQMAGNGTGNDEIKKAKKRNIEYKAKRFDNGDSLKQLLARSRHLLFKTPEKWTKSQRQRAEILFFSSMTPSRSIT